MAIIFKDSKIAGVGKPGLSAYEIVKKYGYEGTEEEFAQNLINADNFEEFLTVHNLNELAHPDIRAIIPTKAADLNAPTTDEMNTAINALSFFHAGTSAPSNTKLLWIDTTANTGGLKYHNGSSWVAVPVLYS